MKTESIQDNDLLDFLFDGSDCDLLGHIQYLRNEKIDNDDLSEFVRDAERMDEIRPLLHNRIRELASLIDTLVEAKEIRTTAENYTRLANAIRNIEYAADLVNVPVPDSIKWR